MSPITTRKNASVKALQTELNRLRKDKTIDPIHREQFLFEYLMACSTDPDLVPHDLQQYLLDHFDRIGQAHGATKATHVQHPDGWVFHHIVVKRIRSWANISLGNQCKFEARTWEHFATSPEADFLCPVLRWYGSRSDKVLENSEKDRENMVMICQKAKHTGPCKLMCEMAEKLNRENGFRGENAHGRYERMRQLAHEQGWWDVLHNGGNSGVVFDYSQNCYKAVFIDYAL